MEVRLTDTALNDLAEIGGYLVDAGFGGASAFVDSIEGKCRELGRMPEAYPLFAGREAEGIRRCVFGRYLIFYRLAGDLVEVLRVVHGARELDNLAFPDDPD